MATPPAGDRPTRLLTRPATPRPVSLSLLFLLLAAALALTLSGCSRPITAFTLHADGTRVGLHADRSAATGRQGEFVPRPKDSGGSPSAVERTTVLYSLDKPLSVATGGEAFYLTYSTSAGPLELHLVERSSKGRTRVESTLPMPGARAAEAAGPISADVHQGIASSSAGKARSARADGAPVIPRTTGAPLDFRLMVPMSAGSKVLAFRVTSSSRAAEIHIRSGGLMKDYRGVSFGPHLISIRKGVALGSPVATGTGTTISFPGLVARLGGAQAQVAVTYTYSLGGGPVRLTATGSGGQSQTYLVNLRPGTHRLYLYTASCGFTPEALKISSANTGFSVDSLTVHRFPTPRTADSLEGSMVPIPADLGAILEYNPKWWRQKDYELFSWSLVPSVIIMEYSSYAVQARYMKRIAYFVEKRGYAGRLWTNAQLKGLIGWNAHDYRPLDLARFFTAAAKEHFALNPEEVHLRSILLANGLLHAGNGSYTAGRGAILTFAHVGTYWLRLLLLTHESFHGIFFTHPAYHKAAFAIWDRTSPEERKLFRNVFLAYEGYDISDMYLVKNEFQAYLMEQPIGSADAYFDFVLLHRLQAMGIPATSPLYRYFVGHPEMFQKSAKLVQQAVKAAVGVSAGETIGLVPQ